MSTIIVPASVVRAAAKKPAAATPKAGLGTATVTLSLGKDLTGGRPAIRQGALASFATMPVTDATGTRTIPYAQLADQVLAIPRARNGRLAAARAGLLADPVVTEEVIETDQSSLLVSTISFTVTDPAVVRANAPELMRRTPKGLTAARLNPTQRKAFDAFKATLGSKPANDPLKLAAAAGDDALISAIAAGKGSQTITTRVRIEKKAPAVTQVSTAPTNPGAVGAVGAKPGKNGGKGGTVSSVPRIPTTVGPTPTTQLVSYGDTGDTVNFLAGFTLGDEIGWDETINVGIGEFTVGAVAEYSFGLRIPMWVKTEVTPAVIANTVENTGDHSFDVALTANAFDGDADFYKSVGLPTADVQQGKELVILGDPYVFIEGEILGVRFDERFPKKPLLDFGDNFSPPYGSCGTSCGFDLWIPAAVTHTTISIAGIVEGSGQLGFNVSGKGTVGVDYESLFDGKVVPSSFGAGAAAKNVNRWEGDGATFVPKMKTEIAAVGTPTTKTFGHRLSNPSFRWDIVATPRVKANVAFDLVVYSDSFDLGPYDLGALAFGIGSLTLGAHANTITTKSYSGGQYVESACSKSTCANVSGAAAVGQAAVADASISVPGASATTTVAGRVPKSTKVPRTSKAPGSATLGSATPSTKVSAAKGRKRA